MRIHIFIPLSVGCAPLRFCPSVYPCADHATEKACISPGFETADGGEDKYPTLVSENDLFFKAEAQTQKSVGVSREAWKQVHPTIAATNVWAFVQWSSILHEFHPDMELKAIS